MVQRVLVTGGTGFIALEVSHQLLTAGKYKVRATVRSLENKARNAPLLELVPGAKQGPPELVKADLLSEDGWAEAVKDVDVVMHTASPFFMSTDEDTLVKPAVEGTLNVLKACAAEGSKVKRVVLTSSVAAVAYGRTDLPGDHVYTEADWTNPDNVDAYTKSKAMAEKAAWDFVKNNTGHGFDLVTINPALVVGHCRTTPGTSVDIIAQMMTGKLPMIPDMKFGVVDVEDVARAHVGGITCTPNERYILSAKVMTFGEIADTLAAEFKPKGVNVTTKRMPYALAWFLSLFTAQMKGIVKGWGKPLAVDGSKVEKEMGFKYKDLAESLKQTGESLIKAGLVVPSK